ARVKVLGGLGAKGRPGNHGNAELTQIENGFIAEAVQMQEAIGLKTITDGEFRRQTWLNDFLGSLTGIGFALVRDSSATAKFRADERVGKSTTEDVENIKVEFPVDGRIEWRASVNVEPFRFLKSVTKDGVPKVTIPAPQNFYYFGGRHCISRAVYPDLAQLWQDFAVAYKKEVGALGGAGCK